MSLFAERPWQNIKTIHFPVSVDLESTKKLRFAFWGALEKVEWTVEVFFLFSFSVRDNRVLDRTIDVSRRFSRHPYARRESNGSEAADPGFCRKSPLEPTTPSSVLNFIQREWCYLLESAHSWKLKYSVLYWNIRSDNFPIWDAFVYWQTECSR